MNFTQIKETCIYSKNLKRSEEFYSSVLELERIGSVENRHVFFKAGSSVLLIFNPEETKIETKLPPHSASGEIHLAFEVEPENYINTRNTIIEKGIKIEQDFDWPRGFKSFYFRDPDNNLLEIVEKGMWEK